jgi:hypothetical protein
VLDRSPQSGKRGHSHFSDSLLSVDQSTASEYERDYNIFNPASQYAPDTPLNPAQAFAPDHPFNPANRSWDNSKKC